MTKKKKEEAKFAKEALKQGFSGDDVVVIGQVLDKSQFDFSFTAYVDIKKRLAEEAPTILELMINKAKESEFKAMAYCLDRFDNPNHGFKVDLKLPPLRTAAEYNQAADSVMERLFSGEITNMQCEQLLNLIAARHKIFQSTELHESVGNAVKQINGDVDD